MRRNLGCGLLLIVVCGLTILAQEPEFRVRVDVTALAPKDERWLELRSKNFLAVGNTDEAHLRRLAADLELFREQFALLFPRARMISSVPTTVVAFRDEDALRPFRRSANGKVEGEDGYFQPGVDVNYLVMKGNSPTRTIYREYIRTLIPDTMGPVPSWFRMGLQEYFATFRVSWSGDSRWIEVGGRDKEFNSLLRNNVLIPLVPFFEARPDEAVYRAEERNSTPYAEAWALTHYLLQGRTNLDQAMEFFQSLAEGTPTADGFHNAFGVDVKKFEGEANDTPADTGFREYVMDSRVGKYNPSPNGPPRSPGGWRVNLAGFSLDRNQTSIRTFFNVARNCPPDDVCGTSLITIPVNYDSIWEDVKQRPVRLLSEAETHFHRGNLMLHIDRKDEADGFLQLALRIDGRLASAYAALGWLRTGQARFQEARQSLLQAVTLDPNNYLAHYYTALSAQKQAETSGPPATDQLQFLSAELKRTVELAPHFVEASQMLAEINAQRMAELDESIDLVREAMKRSPGRESLILTLARVLAANRNTAEAGRTLDRVAASRTAEAFMKDAVDEMRKLVREIPEERGAVQEFFAPAAAAVTQESIEVRTDSGDIPVGVLVPLSPRQALVGETVRGRLTALDCAQGLTLIVESEGRIVRLRTATPDKIEFLRHTTSVSTTISCGPLPNVPVSITYRPQTSGNSVGEPLRVEFLEEAR